MCDKKSCRYFDRTAVNATSRAANSGASTSRALDDSGNTSGALNDTTGTVENKKTTDGTLDDNENTNVAFSDSNNATGTPNSQKDTASTVGDDKNTGGTPNDNRNTARPRDHKKKLTVVFDSDTSIIAIGTQDINTEPSSSGATRTVDELSNNKNSTMSFGSPNNETLNATNDDESTRGILMMHLTAADALIEMLPEKERSLPTEWLKIIERERENRGKPLEEASQYARYLSLALATGVFTQAPFHQSPPSALGDAPPLTDDLWSSIIASCSLDVTWAQELASNSKSAAKHVLPKDFFKSQPTPPCGAICYMAALSDMSPF